MQRRIEIDGVTYICNVGHNDETEYWSVANARLLAEHLKKNGYEVEQVIDDDCPQRVLVKYGFRSFNDMPYWLNQCEGDLLEWCKDSMEGDFTNYYDKVVFNTGDRFIAAYRDDINNYWEI